MSAWAADVADAYRKIFWINYTWLRNSWLAAIEPKWHIQTNIKGNIYLCKIWHKDKRLREGEGIVGKLNNNTIIMNKK